MRILKVGKIGTMKKSWYCNVLQYCHVLYVTEIVKHGEGRRERGMGRRGKRELRSECKRKQGTPIFMI